MPTRHGPYPRPFLEIEFDRQALTQGGCCRYVPVILRICSVPERVMLTISFERVRKQDQDGTYLDDYDVRSLRPHLLRASKDFSGYYEYAFQMLARPHAEETGTIHLKIESQSYSLLSETTYRFDSREQEPVRANFHDGSFRGVRLLPFLRAAQERDALRGQYPAFVRTGDESSSPPLVPSTRQSTEDTSSLRMYWMRGG